MSAEPVPQRRRLSAEQRREQLIGATVRVVADQGYRAASADAIVAEAGVSKGLLWRYFADVDDLMHQAARHTLLVIAREVGSGLDLDGPAPEVFRAAIHRAAALLHTHPAERRALQQIVINLRTSDGRQRLTLDDYEDLYAGQEALFRKGQAEGHVDPHLDPRLLAVTYQGAVDAMLGYLESHPDLDPETYADTVATVLFDGLGPRG